MNTTKIVLLLIFVSIVSSLLFADTELVFETYEKSIVMVELSVFLDQKHVENPQLFRKIEKEYETEILDSYFPIATGSGFFITRDGYLLTNQHVIKIEDEDYLKKIIYNKTIYNFFSKIPGKIINNQEYNLLRSDLKQMFNNSSIHYRVLVNNKDYYEVEIVTENEAEDFAILKAKSKKAFKPIPLGQSSQVKVGSSVIAIGYPIPGAMFTAVKEVKSTLTVGSVSSIRSDTWGIQHTAAINPGNSGGPLFNASGEIIGINVGLMQNANDIYFSIPIDIVKEWLSKNKLKSLIRKNKSHAVYMGKKYQTNIDTGSKILVKLPEGYKVYVNGKYKGKTPLLLEGLKAGKNSVHIESETEFSSQVFKVNPRDKEIFTYLPIMEYLTGSLYVNSSPSGAEVLVDDIIMGETPIVITDLKLGKHQFMFKLDGYLSDIDEVTVIKGKTARFNKKLEKGHQIIFKNKLPDNALIEVDSGQNPVQYGVDEKIMVRTGQYKIKVSCKNYHDLQFEVKVGNNDLIVDKKIESINARVVLKNLKSDSKVLINGQDKTAQLKDNELALMIGSYDLKIVTEGYKDFVKKINVKEEKTTRIDVNYLKKLKNPLAFRNAGIAFLISGLVLVTPGIFFMLPIGLGVYFFSSSYLIKVASLAVTIAGACLIGLGFVLCMICIPFFVVFNKDKNQRYSFIFDYQDNQARIGLAFKL